MNNEPHNTHPTVFLFMIMLHSPNYTSANRAGMDIEAQDKMAYCSDLHPFMNLLHMQMVVAFGFGALFGMRTKEVANLTWERVLFEIKRIILALKRLRTITLAGGFDKSHQQSLMKPTARRQTDGKVCDIIEDSEAPNCLVKNTFLRIRPRTSRQGCGGRKARRYGPLLRVTYKR
jgi:hypothetical protein